MADMQIGGRALVIILVLAGSLGVVPGAADAAQNCVLTRAGDVYCEGGVQPVRVRVTGKVVQLAASGDSTCALTEPGEVYCWVANPATDQAAGNPAGANQVAGQAAGNQAGANQVPGQAAGNQAGANQVPGQAPGNQADGNQASANQAAADQAGANPAGGDQGGDQGGDPATADHAADQLASGQSALDQAAAEVGGDEGLGFNPLVLISIGLALVGGGCTLVRMGGGQGARSRAASRHRSAPSLSRSV
jgi:hypothetical protein